MKSDRYLIDGDSFWAEFRLNPITHKVTETAPLIHWMNGWDRFMVFRVVARRGWRIIVPPIPDQTHEQLKQHLQPHFQAAHAEPLPSEGPDEVGTSL